MTTHSQSIPAFDPNGAALEDSGIFGLPFSFEESALVLLPVPWEVTTSYGGGTSQGPEAIFEASKQMDLYDLDVLKPYEPGIHFLPISEEVQSWNEEGKAAAQLIIAEGGRIEGNSELEAKLDQVNRLSRKLNDWVYAQSARVLSAGKILGLVGGDHSTPQGAIRAIAERHPGVGVLHFDAHSDTRDAYEGFQYSHASIMRNVLNEIPNVKKLVQVGIRDFCEEEVEYCKAQGDRVKVYFDLHLAHRKMGGETWKQIASEIVAQLPQEVYISFDIDGLDPSFCPHTGTPVAGGLHFHEATYLIGEVVRSGRKIVGFDLNEVSPDLGNLENEWDANVGMRLLYKLCAWTLASQGRCQRVQG